MKTKREMGFLSLVIAILVAIQLIPFGLTQVKANPVNTVNNLKITLQFVETVNGQEVVKANDVLTIPGKTVTDLKAEERTKDKIFDWIKSAYEAKKNTLQAQYNVGELTIDSDQLEKFQKFDGKTELQGIIVKSELTAKSIALESLKITVKFAGTVDGKQVSENVEVSIPGKTVTDLKAEERTKDKIFDWIKSAYEAKKNTLQAQYNVGELTIASDQLDKFKDFDGKAAKEIIIKSELTAKSIALEPLKITVKFAGTVDGKQVSENVEVSIPGKTVTDLKAEERTKDKIFDWIKSAYEAKKNTLQAQYNVGELTIDSDQLDKFKDFDGKAAKEIIVKSELKVKPADLKPLEVKATITLPSKQRIDNVEFTIPGADVKKQNVESFNKDQLKKFLVGTDAYKKAVKDHESKIKNHGIKSFDISPDDLAKVNQYIQEDKYQKPAEVSIKVVYEEEATEPSKSDETKKTEADKRYASKSSKYAAMSITRRNGKALDDIDFDIDADVEALTQSIVRSKSIPLPQGDRFIGQLFQVTIKADGKTLTRKEMSKEYEINLSLATFEKARKNNLTVYAWNDDDEKWERINRFGYNKDGTLSIEGIDTYTEFVVWLDQEKNDRKLQFAGSMNAKDPGNRQGFTPRVLAPYNPQVAGAANANPNAYLPTTGEGNFAGWVAASLVLAALALVTKKIVK